MQADHEPGDARELALSLTSSVAKARIDDGEEVRRIMRWTGYRGFSIT
jgi:hypothetical protein